ncbi:hypothetical protein [Nostoc sp.]|uniref:hypothetical protein n=1 Tax=Nostoc sp. TaxID=1180 RepID=UPI002FF53C48
METILNCLQIWASKILQRFFVGWALPSNTSNTKFWTFGRTFGALEAQRRILDSKSLP